MAIFSVIWPGIISLLVIVILIALAYLSPLLFFKAMPFGILFICTLWIIYILINFLERLAEDPLVLSSVLIIITIGFLIYSSLQNYRIGGGRGR